MSNTTGSTDTTKSKPNAAKGNQQGQTTLAAKIARWETLVNNMTPEFSQVAKFQEPLAQFRANLAEAKAMLDRQKALRADLSELMTHRNDLLATGDELYGRISLGLMGFLGPKNDQLRAVGLKARKNIGRPRKGTVPPPLPELAPAPAPVSHPEPQK